MIEYESDTIVIFKDIHPASDFHYLAIPKIHIKDPKCVTSEHLPLRELLVAIQCFQDYPMIYFSVLEMREQLKVLVRSKVTDLAEDELSLGFHWPPFNSIGHLHMHAIAPVSKMGFLQRQMYRKDSWWYRQVTNGWMD